MIRCSGVKFRRPYQKLESWQKDETMFSRRQFLAGTTTLAAMLPIGKRVCWAEAKTAPPVIEMAGTARGKEVWFDPIGLWVPPGTVIRWVTPSWETQHHAPAAYHPDNMNRPLRIPEQATPWDSGYLQPGKGAFETLLTVEGVYDYFCRPHEEAGMVGRIVVGRPNGHDLQDFAKAAAEHPGWRPVPEQALSTFPSIEEILDRKIVPRRTS